MTVSINSAPPLGIPDIDLKRWRNVPVAVTVDLSTELRQVDPAIRPLRPAGTQPLLFGRAVTAHCEAPDFGAVLYAIDLMQPGDVLMIAADGNTTHAMIGDVLGGLLRSRGIAGVVCDGAVRDVATIATWDNFPVFTRSVTPRGPTGYQQGSINDTVTLGGCEIHPGDLIVGDDDGVIALSAIDAAKWIDAAEARLITEEDWRSRLFAGETAQSVFSL